MEGEAAQFDNLAVEATNGLIAITTELYNVFFGANTVIENIGVASKTNKAKLRGG